MNIFTLKENHLRLRNEFIHSPFGIYKELPDELKNDLKNIIMTELNEKALSPLGERIYKQLLIIERNDRSESNEHYAAVIRSNVKFSLYE